MTHDIVVCGAGLAGSAVARRLAAGGARIALVGTESRPGCEGLSARSRALLAEEGLDASCRLHRGAVRTPRRVGRGPRRLAGTESLVERSYLAKALCERAQAAGADHRHDVVTHARARRATSGASRCDRRKCSRRRCSSRREAAAVPRAAGPCCSPSASAFGARANGHCGDRHRRHGLGWCWWAEQGPMIWVQVIGRPRSAHPARAGSRPPPRACRRSRRALEGAEPDGAPVARPAHARLGMPRGTTRAAGASAMRRWRWTRCPARACTRRCAVRGWWRPRCSRRGWRRAVLAQRFVAQRHARPGSARCDAAGAVSRERPARGVLARHRGGI